MTPPSRAAFADLMLRAGASQPESAEVSPAHGTSAKVVLSSPTMSSHSGSGRS